jgi:hypothetical protein
MTKQYNKQYFVLSNNDNSQFVFVCYTTITRSGFCHTVQTLNNSIFGNKVITDTKSSYYNRTWERYDYESTLKRACKKLGASVYKNAFIDNNINRTY